MRPLPAVITLLGASLLSVPTSSGAAASPQGPTEVPVMIETIFAHAPNAEQAAVVVKDERDRVYLAFYRSHYADVAEVRAYAIPFRNVMQSAAEGEAVDAALAAGDAAAAFDLLLRIMRIDLGAQYVSDVGLDGVHEGEVAVGSGHMRDRFHNQVFADHAAADEAYHRWLERAVELAAG